jgi:hypothetical protein
MMYQKISKFASSNPKTSEKSASIAPQSIPSSQTPIAHFHDFTQIPVHSPVIQAKLTIGAPNDRYEQEADRVAAQVVQQLYCPASIQRSDGLDEMIQAKSMLQRPDAIGGGEASTQLSSEINNQRGGGEPLDVGLQQSMGQAMGADFSRVRVHTDGQSDRLNQSIQSKAFTTGHDVFFRQGSYEPASQEGQELIAHELAHVVQQHMALDSEEKLQRMPIDKLYDKRKKQALNNLSDDDISEEKVKECYTWSADVSQFEIFTAHASQFYIYEKVKGHGTSGQTLMEESGGDSSKYISTAKDIIVFKENRAKNQNENISSSAKKEEKKPKVEETKIGKIPKEISFDFSSTPSKIITTKIGDSLQDLENIDRGKNPSIYLATMYKIQPNLKIGDPILLGSNKDTVNVTKTVEVKVSLDEYFVVIHYHPNVANSKGISLGESNMHVKGTRYVKHHETLSDQFIKDCGIPTIQKIREKYN